MGICGCSIPKPGGCDSCNPMKSSNFIGYSHPVYTTNNSSWICPHCNRANAPWMPYCCKPETQSVSVELNVKS